MLPFLTSVSCAIEPEFDVFFGAVSTINNTFLSHKLPGFHKCGKHKFQVRYLPGERMVRINLEKTDKNGTYFENHCSLLLDGEIIQKIQNEFRPFSYLSFYFRGQQYLGHFFVEGSNQIFTHYHINIPSDFKESAQFSVEPSVPIPLVPATYMNISFSASFIEAMKQEESTNMFPPLYLFVSLILILLIIIIMLCYRSYFQTHDHAPVSEIWKRPRSFANNILFATAGVQVLFSIVAISIKIKDNSLTDNMIYNIIYISTAAASFFRGVVGMLFGDELMDSDFLAPTLFMYSFVLFPLRVINVISNMFKSFRGPRLLNVVIGDFIFLIIDFLLSRTIADCFNGITRNLTPVPYSKNTNTQKIGFKWTVFSFLISVVNAGVLFLAVSNIFVDVIYQRIPNYALISSSLILYASLVSFLSLLRTVSKLKYSTENWLESHCGESTKTILILIPLILFSLSSVEGFRSHQGYLYLACFSFGIFTTIFSVGAFASFLTAFIFTAITFRRQKVN